MKTCELFRSEALVAPAEQYGSVFLNTPLHVRFVTFAGLLLLSCLIFFVMFFEFAESCRVQGALVPDKGMIHLYAQKSGVVLHRYAQAGEHVKKGAPLFLIDSSLVGSDGADAHYRADVFKKNQRGLEREIVEKTEQLHNLNQLFNKKYISLEVYQASKDTLRVLREKLRALKLEIITESRLHSWYLTASVDGLLTYIMLQAGDTLLPNTCAAIIIPDQSKMLVELYTLMHQVRFLKTQQQIILRYDSFPNPESRPAHATIEKLGSSILTDQDERKSILIGAPYYKAIASLEQQQILSGGEVHELKPGMTLWATVRGPRKKIWQWLLGPLYAALDESWL